MKTEQLKAVSNLAALIAGEVVILAIALLIPQN
jgi:hypothetical protein